MANKTFNIYGKGIQGGNKVKIDSVAFGRCETHEENSNEHTECDVIYTTFISYANRYETLAKLVKEFTETFFPRAEPCFISGMPCSVAAGSDWLRKVESALETAEIHFILANSYSLSRPWINFELGATWLRGVPLVFLCFDDLEPRTLPLPYQMRQALELSPDNPVESLKTVIEHIESALDCRAAPRSSMEFYADKLEEELHKIS